MPSLAVAAETTVWPAPGAVSVTEPVPSAPSVTDEADSVPGPEAIASVTTAPALPVAVTVALVAPAAGGAIDRPRVRGVALSVRAVWIRAATAALVVALLVGLVARSSPRSTQIAIWDVEAWVCLAGVGAPVGVSFWMIQSTARSCGVASGTSVTSDVVPAAFWLRNLVVSMQYATTGLPPRVRLIVPDEPPGPWAPLGRK